MKWVIGFLDLILFNFSLVSLVKNHGLFDFYYVDPSFNLEKIISTVGVSQPGGFN